MVLGLPDLDPSIFSTDLDPSINKKKSKKNLDFYRTIFLILYDFLSMKTDANVPSKSKKQKTLKKTYF
jgi:hypothetical protein